MADCPGQNVEFADAVHDAAQHRLVGIHLRVGARQYQEYAATTVLRSQMSLRYGSSPPTYWHGGSAPLRRRLPRCAPCCSESINRGAQIPTARPLRLRDAEFAIRMSRAANAGSEPTTGRPDRWTIWDPIESAAPEWRFREKTADPPCRRSVPQPATGRIRMRCSGRSEEERYSSRSHS